MRALLSAVGTRGDVQPIVAVAVQVRALGHEVRLCVPPNFVAQVRGLGFDAVPVGIEMRAGAAKGPVPDLITDQFDAVGAAVEGCDVILGGNAHQYAARSIAELRSLPYVTALYAPVALPSPDHAPPPAPGTSWRPGGDAATNLSRWADNQAAWNARALERVNANRARLGLAPIDDVLRFNITGEPWLATDAALAPVPSTPGMHVVATGAWIFADDAPLAPELERFLAAGDAPIYLGFGSMPAPAHAGRILVDAARAAGRRAVVSRGWAGLDLDDTPDCLAVDDLNQQALFPRVAAVVHHGGAGTTAAAARAGVPQVIAPMFSDQFYWASRVRALGLGGSIDGALGVDALAAALRDALDPAVAARAASFARELDDGGARRAAERLVALGA